MVRLSKNKITRFYHDYYWPLLLVPFLLLFVSLNAFLFLFVVPTGISLFTLSISTLNHDENGPKKMPSWYGILTGGEHHHKWHHEHATDTSGEGWLDYVANAVGTKRVKK
jgi:sterol desaturase/sphingolipid hydroxylase (fatty acid hydroxylase superfamily)